MTTEITKRTATEVTLLIKLGEADIIPVKAGTFDRLRGRVKAPGFRPGKAPDTVVVRQLGDAMVQSEVLEAAVERSYAEAVREHSLPVMARPEVTMKKFVPYTELEYEATVDVIPEVRVADFKKMRKAKPAVQVEDSDIEKVIGDLRQRLAKRATVQRPAQMGDEVLLDFVGSVQGQPISGASGQNYTLRLGSGTFVPGYEEQVVGMAAGGEKTFSVTFPKDYSNAELAGRPVEFKVKLTEVRELQLPDVDDAFALEVSGLPSVSKLQANIRARVQDDKRQEAERQYEQELLDEIVKQSRFEIPKRLMREQLTRLKRELEQNLSYSGLDLDKYLQMRKQTPEQLEAELRPQAERRAGLALVLSQIAKDEQLNVTLEELEAELVRLKQEYSDAQMQAELDKPETREEVFNHLLSLKVVDTITKYALSDSKE